MASFLPPNPRLQRTRSASPASPLSRKPFGVTKSLLGGRSVIAVASFLLFFGISPGAPLKSGTRYRIFFPQLTLNSADGERIDRLDISMACGSFRSISTIPEDWSVQVVSPSSARTSFAADAGHGATSLWNLRQFQGALTISVDERECFELSAKVTAVMQDSSRIIDIPLSKLVLRP